jgi:ankyrin repeat protein
MRADLNAASGQHILITQHKHERANIPAGLIAAGADVNTVGRGALVLAVLSNNETAVKLLIEHGADINSIDSQGNNVLFAAAHNGHVSMMQLLVQRLSQPLVFARIRAVSLFAATALTAAPCCISHSTAALCPPMVATISSVRPLLSTAVTLRPRCTSNFIMLICPAYVVLVKAVVPELSFSLIHPFKQYFG